MVQGYHCTLHVSQSSQTQGVMYDSRLYIRVRTVSAGCIAAQTETPETIDATR
jgi:hypothetical protein